MWIQVICPHCGAQTSVPEQPDAQKAFCTVCGRELALPPLGPVPVYGPPVKSAGMPAWAIVLIVAAILVPIMMMIGLVGVSLLLPRMLATKEKAEANAAKVQLSSLQMTLEMYHLNLGDYPTTEQGLEALLRSPADLPDAGSWNGPYLDGETLPLDPWQQPYQYEYPGTHDPDEPDIWSFGPDGMNGTDDDIGSWDERP